jgi:hypothetical protein
MAKQYKENYDYSKQQKDKTRIAWEIYRGKLAILRMYEELGIHNAYTDKLRKEVRRRQQYLINRGEI